MARTTYVTRTEFDALASDVSKILGLLEGNAPAKAKPARKPAKKATRKAAPKAKPATKGVKGYRTGEGMTRADWNKTLSTKARFAGGGTYKAVMADWAEVQNLRNAGATPDEVLALFTA